MVGEGGLVFTPWKLAAGQGVGFFGLFLIIVKNFERGFPPWRKDLGVVGFLGSRRSAQGT